MRARRGYGKHTIPQRALSALEAGGDMTSEEIGVAIGASAKSTQATLARMKPEGLLHICGWLRPGKRGPLLAKYRIGSGEDAPHIGPAKSKRRDAGPIHVRRHAIEIALYGGPASVAVRIPAVPVAAWEAA